MRLQNSLQDLQGIMQRTEEAMLAVTPCDDTDTYFSMAIEPHRVVCKTSICKHSETPLNTPSNMLTLQHMHRQQPCKLNKNSTGGCLHGAGNGENVADFM